MISLKNKKRILIFSLLFFLSSFGKLEAATLFIKPAQTEVSVGNIINVQILVDTSGKFINNAESIISFPKDLLEVISLDNKSSIFSLWVENPSFSNSIGQVTWNGGVPNPGFQGGNGNIVSIIFKAKKVGTASIIFSNSAVRENDGLGTDILSSQRGSTITIVNNANTKIEPVVQPKVDEPIGVSIITSKTNPDQTKWYSDNTPEFSWDLPKDATGVRTLIGTASNGVPRVEYVPPISTKKVDALPDGIYYFSLQIKTANGWGDIHRYRVNIDTTPPRLFSITFPHGEKSFDPEPIILFNTIDNESGISHYDIKVGDAGPERAAPLAISNPYSLPTQYPGTHTVTVKAVDRAGNSTNASADFTVEAIESPIITYYPEEMQFGDIMKIRGTTYPNSDIIVLIKQDDKIFSEESTRSNSSGDFSLVATRRLETGVYEFTARITDERGAKSNETKPLTVVVKSKFLTDLTAFILNYLSVAILALLAAAGLAGLGIIMWYKFARIIRNLRRESKEAEQVLEKSFNILRKDLREHIAKLKRAESKRKLTEEEIEFLEQFEEELEDAENAIDKEIADITRS